MSYRPLLGSCLSADCVHRVCTFFLPGDNEGEYCSHCGCSRHHHRLMGFTYGRHVFDTSHVLPRERFYDWELRVNNCHEMHTQVEADDLNNASSASSVTTSTTSYSRSGIAMMRPDAATKAANARTNVFGDTSLLFRPANVMTSGKAYRYSTPTARKWEDLAVRTATGVTSTSDYAGSAEVVEADFPVKRPKTEG